MNIKTIAAVSVAAVLSMLAVASLALIQPATTGAQSNRNQNNNDKKSETKKPVSYNYMAQADDSYSKMARKAIQTYGLKNKVNLSQSRIIYAETNLTQQAGSPELNLGQAVSFSEDTVKEWVEKARKLSDADAAKWDKYVANVNFNTDNVGEAR